MVELTGRPKLLLEATQKHGVDRHLARHHLDGDNLAGLAVASLVDGPHAALGDLLDKIVTADGLERRVGCLGRHRRSLQPGCDAPPHRRPSCPRKQARNGSGSIFNNSTLCLPKTPRKKTTGHGPNPSSQPSPRSGEGGERHRTSGSRRKSKIRLFPFCSPSPLRGGGQGEGFCRSVPKYRDRFRHPCLTREKAPENGKNGCTPHVIPSGMDKARKFSWHRSLDPSE